MKKMFYKLLGYQYKIVVIKTAWWSEFYRTGVAKIEIDMNCNSVFDFIKPPFWSFWDKDEIRIIYTKDPLGIHTNAVLHSDVYDYRKGEIVKLFHK